MDLRGKFSTDFSIENKYASHIIAGIDEVGRGAWAGPVVAGAVIIRQPSLFNEIIDSKQTSSEERESLNHNIFKDHYCAIGIASVEEINSLGLNPAIFLAMERALNSLNPSPTIALVDGNYKLNFPIQTLSVIKGDQKSISIAAASIIAKTYRDKLMRNLSKEHPQYIWENNVGYGTAKHIEMIKKYGISKYHRKNFRPLLDIFATEQKNYRDLNIIN
jgi:ribonuclease HII